MINRVILALPLFISTFALAGNFTVIEESSEILANAKASPPHRFATEVKKYEYDIEIDPSSLVVSKALFSFQFADLDSNSAKRDSKMRSWMNVDKNPTARFELVSTERMEDNYLGRGRFFMNEVERDIAIEFSVTFEEERIVLNGVSKFEYTDWDLEIVSLLFFKVNPSLEVQFHLEGRINER